MRMFTHTFCAPQLQNPPNFSIMSSLLMRNLSNFLNMNKYERRLGKRERTQGNKVSEKNGTGK